MRYSKLSLFSYLSLVKNPLTICILTTILYEQPIFSLQQALASGGTPPIHGPIAIHVKYTSDFGDFKPHVTIFLIFFWQESPS